MKDIQILWAACKYHWRRFKYWFKEPEYTKRQLQRELYWNAYRSWQIKRFGRRMCNIGTDLFEADTNISDGIKR